MNKFDDQYIKKFQKDAVAEHRHEYHDVDGIYFETEQEKQDWIKNKEGKMNTTKVTVASTETVVLKTEELIMLGEILQNPKYNSILEQHYIDLFGSRGELIGTITDDLLQTIIEGVIEVANDNIEVDGRGDDIQTYVNLDNDGRQMNELKTWVRQKLMEK